MEQIEKNKKKEFKCKDDLDLLVEGDIVMVGGNDGPNEPEVFEGIIDRKMAFMREMWQGGPILSSRVKKEDIGMGERILFFGLSSYEFREYHKEYDIDKYNSKIRIIKKAGL